MRLTASLAIAFLVCALAGWRDDGPDASDPPTPGAALVWQSCDAQSTVAGFSCATLKVPLDYTKPNGEQIGIALIRLQAKDKAQRIGSLVFNFGGPGGSGVTTLLGAGQAFSTLNQRYDLVSFDPRGVERSEGVHCLRGPALEKWLDAEPSEDTATETKLTKAFSEGCQRLSGRVLPYVGTINAVRDMERMRAALGDPKLNFFGFSYGTQLGAVYASQFPKNVGRMVLDSAVDPAISSLESSRIQIMGFQHAYEDYLADCVKQGCALGKDTAAANATILGLLDDLAKQPLNVEGRTVTRETGRTAVAEALYSKLSWPLLTDAISDALKGDGAGLLNLADQFNGRNPDGTYNTLQSSLVAISCADTTDRPTIARAEALMRELTPKAPIFASEAAGAGTCSLWPFPGEDKNHQINATGSNPIVVVGVTGDPATPYQWAQSLTRQLRTATLITLEGEGHGAYGQSPCVDAAVNNYLLNGTVPAPNLHCP
ncbi:alpha/beta fold hydrolase [Streptosporangiaceae bacterium NEAU-GS5]|nr:alpha/beta fold hydrolase [Streptosporangiaceae bacterium NEAU-GS5]